MVPQPSEMVSRPAEMVPQLTEMVPQLTEMAPHTAEMIKQHCGTISADDYSNITLIITKIYIKIIF